MLSHECTNMFCMPRLSAHYGGNARICFVCHACPPIMAEMHEYVLYASIAIIYAANARM